MSDTMRRLTLDDIADARAYERERDAFRDRVIALKRRRRIAVGPFVTLVFENRDTVRFQIQEMARAERLHTDEQIITELDIYNPLIPDPGTLSATLFIELQSKDALREWLPKLVGIEWAVELRIGPLGGAEVVRAIPEEAHAERLTRDDVTASVHYVRFRLTPGQVERVARERVAVAVAHEHYRHESELAPATVEELLDDLRG